VRTGAGHPWAQDRSSQHRCDARRASMDEKKTPMDEKKASMDEEFGPWMRNLAPWMRIRAKFSSMDNHLKERLFLVSQHHG